VIYVWVHAEALSDSGLDPTNLSDMFAAVKRHYGWSGDPDSEDVSIYLTGALVDPSTREGDLAFLGAVGESNFTVAGRAAHANADYGRGFEKRSAFLLK
jgi:hypothetical protein